MAQGVILDRQKIFGGPARLVKASTGSAQPSLIEHIISPTGAKGLNPDWTDIGATEDGVTLTVSKETEQWNVDESVYTVREPVTNADFTVEASLAENNLNNLVMAWEALPIHTTAGGGSNVAQQKVHMGVPTLLSEQMIAFIVEKPDGKLRAYAFYKAALTGADSEHKYAKANKTLVPISWKARPDTDKADREAIGAVLDET